MSVNLAAVEARYCGESPDLEPADPELVAVFAALRSALAVLERQERSGNSTEALRASKVRWASEQHVDLGAAS
jgi:hypothetical protein